ncbi:MAG: serine/threonine protein kinase, partial [Gemmatimonadetes bacterium]|nr:serine/threonine protein kinase [Gemmatimonadota bacterium]
MSDPITRLNAALEGRYRIERELGEGGMATVYLAEDIKHERKVALKVLKPELAAVVGAERFLAEIKTTANLTHPHILPLHDSGEADGFLFYVMPHVEGESLRERLDREHQLPVDEAIHIATNVAEALDYAHRQGVIHRDIKPANILLQDGKPVISDFGIALAVGVAGGGRLTETGLSLGTPHYMSPEQATGDQTTGPATDTYALGCVLYEMLVGEPPYTGSTAQAILGKIIAGELASATEERASVPANVDAAIRKALEKIPADRFTGAQEFAKALADPGFRHGETAGAGSAAGAGPWKKAALALTASTVLFG